jgi:AraC-like DNA-binding protein
MIYLEQTPSVMLQPWVRSLWYCRAPEVPHRRERVLPNGSMQVILSLSHSSLTECGPDGMASVAIPRAIVVGARGRYEVIDTSDLDELVGIAFRAGGFARVFRERADLFFEQSIGLDDVWPSRELLDRVSSAATPVEKLSILDELLCERVDPKTSRCATVDHALHLFRGKELRIAECARAMGLSERRLSQVFREEVGLAPKMWCRIRRFQSAVSALHRGVDVPWAELALDCGYYDQSHFANDFRAFSGIDPTTYSALRGRWHNHVPVL